MKLTAKERSVLSMLRELDAQQRDKLLKDIEIAAIANRVTKRAGSLKRVSPVLDHKVVSAFGLVPRNATKRTG